MRNFPEIAKESASLLMLLNFVSNIATDLLTLPIALFIDVGKQPQNRLPLGKRFS
jgi:hypothetical protein